MMTLRNTLGRECPGCGQGDGTNHGWQCNYVRYEIGDAMSKYEIATLPVSFVVIATVSGESLMNMIKESTAFRGLRDLLIACDKGYTPMLSKSNASHVIIEAVLSNFNIKCNWRD